MLCLTNGYADSTYQQEIASESSQQNEKKDGLTTFFDAFLNMLNVWDETAEKVEEDEELQTSWGKIKNIFKDAFSSATDKIENDKEIKTSSQKIVDTFKEAFNSAEKEMENDEKIMASLNSLNKTLQQANQEIFAKIEKRSNTQTTSRQSNTLDINNDILKQLPSYNSLSEINHVADFADYAVLAWAAYGDNFALKNAKARGWKVVDNRDVYNLVGGNTVGTLFRSTRNTYVFAFRGTEEKEDWVTNAGTFDLTPLTNQQISKARRIADEMSEFYGIAFVGHSLGGRMAQVAHHRTGHPAFTFNSADLGANDKLIMRKDFAINIILSRSNTKASLIKFRSPYDPLTNAFPGVTKTSTVRNITNQKGLVEDHSMQHLALAMQEVRQVLESYRNN